MILAPSTQDLNWQVC